MNRVRSLWSGEIPLSRAFWLHMPAMYLPIPVFHAILGPSIAVKALLVLWMAYILVALVGIWKSADGYDGHDHWAILAKGAVTLTGFFLSIRILVLFGELLRMP